jgi:hypothetical protein
MQEKLDLYMPINGRWSGLFRPDVLKLRGDLYGNQKPGFPKTN